MDSQPRSRRPKSKNSNSKERGEGNRLHSAIYLNDDSPHERPVLFLANTVVLPHTSLVLYVESAAMEQVIDAAMLQDEVIFIVPQEAPTSESNTSDFVDQIGVEAIIEARSAVRAGMFNVTVRGLRRARLLHLTEASPYPRAQIIGIAESHDMSAATFAQMRVIKQRYEQIATNNPRTVDSAIMIVMQINEAGTLADAIAMSLDLPPPIRLAVLNIVDSTERLAFIDTLLTRELEILELETRIQQNVQHELDRGQKEFYLREQIRVIQRELAENDPALREGLDVRAKIEAAGMPAEVQARAIRELERLDTMPTMAPEYAVLRSYLDWLITLPWKQNTVDQVDLEVAAQLLDGNHYGLKKTKERLLEFLAVRKLKPESRSPILCLVGPPGVGKTSLGKSVAAALGRKFVRVSLGGVRDEAEIRGHRRTYVGALPGRIIQTMRTAGTTNPVFVLDEIDKLASDSRGDPASALLEVLDPEQNNAFSDHYLEVPYDLSKVIFILTANSLQPLASALLDRMEVIELPGYSEEEKTQIAMRFLINRQMEDHGLSASKIEIREDAIQRIITEYTREAGVRNLEREIGTVMRKVARRVAEKKRGKVIVTAAKLPDFLGHPKGFVHEPEDVDMVGIAMGVAWTPYGGDLLPIEIAVVSGSGKITLTGQLGEVLRESAQAALTFARSRDFALTPNFYEKYDIHIHLAMGGIPKDGPSAGVPIAMAIISALTGRAVKRDVAMTGEITLRGRVLPVGGVREKVLAAYRAGLKRFIIPRKNLIDLEDEISDDVRSAIAIIPVDTLDDVITLVLASPPQVAHEYPVATIAKDEHSESDAATAINSEQLPNAVSNVVPLKTTTRDSTATNIYSGS